jgi:hypothetical protein
MKLLSETDWYVLPRTEKGDHFPGRIDAVERVRVREVPRRDLQVNEACRVSSEDFPLGLLLEAGREFQRLTVESQSADEAKISFEVWRRVL